MSTLAPLGTFSYNGYSFSSSLETRSFSAKPVYDAAERTVVYTQFSITVREIITGAPTDSAVVLARRLLSKPGGTLIIRNRGCGDFNINVANQRDVAWGPKPREVDFKYLGRDQACELIWKVDFCVPDCSAAVFQFALLEFNYSVTYTGDRSGLTTRKLTGHLRIPMTRKRQSDRQLPDCVDDYRELIAPKTIPHFRRLGPGEFTISEDKTRLDFSFVDEQLPGPAPPPGIIEVDASHSLTTGTAALTTWAGTIEATYEVEVGRNKQIAMVYFLHMAKARADADAKAAGRGNSAVIPVRFSMAEPQIYGKKHASFSLSYTITINTDGRKRKDYLTQFLTQNGLWKTVPNSDYLRWNNSMKQAFGVRGSAGLRLLPSDDILMDLCINDDPPTQPTPSKRTQLGSYQPPLFDVFPTPSRDASWVMYECRVEILSDDGVSELRPLPTATLTPEPPKHKGVQTGMPTQSSGARIINDFIPTSKQVANPPQRRVQPKVVVYLIGKALRAGFAIPCPTLAAVEGMKPVSANRLEVWPREGFSSDVVGNVGVPLFRASWRLRFLLDKVPAGGIEALTPKNPLEGQ